MYITKLYSAHAVLENRRNGRAGKAGGESVVQPRLLVRPCFPTEVAFVRNACWLLCGVINLQNVCFCSACLLAQKTKNS